MPLCHLRCRRGEQDGLDWLKHAIFVPKAIFHFSCSEGSSFTQNLPGSEGHEHFTDRKENELNKFKRFSLGLHLGFKSRTKQFKPYCSCVWVTSSCCWPCGPLGRDWLWDVFRMFLGFLDGSLKLRNVLQHKCFVFMPGWKVQFQINGSCC